MNDSTLKNQFNVTYTIYAALLFGQVFFFAIALYAVENGIRHPDAALDEIFKILIPVFGILAMFGSYKFYNFKISSITGETTLLQKLNHFRTIKIIQWAILEGAGFFSLVAFLLTSNYFYIIVFLFIMGFNLLSRPSKENFFADFKISQADKSLF